MMIIRFHLFRMNTLKRRLIVVPLLIILPAVTLPTLFLVHTSVMNQKNAFEQNSLRLFSRSEERLSALLLGANMVASTILSSDAVCDYLYTRFDDSLQETLAMRDMARWLEANYMRQDKFSAILFFRESGGMCGVTPTRRLFFNSTNDSFTKSAAYREILTAPYDTLKWIGSYPLDSFYEADKPNGKWILCGLKRLYYRSSKQQNPSNIMMLVGINERSVYRCFDFLFDSKSDAFLLDAKGAQISGLNPSLCGTVPDFWPAIDQTSEFGEASYSDVNGKQYQLIHYRIAEPGWQLIRRIPLNAYLEATRPVVLSAILIGIVTLMVICGIYAFWASILVKPIDQLTAALGRVRNGDLSVRIEGRLAPEEFELMRRQFNRMLDNIVHLMEQQKAQEQEQVELEMRSLQAQINPHFIYNSISSIRWMATMTGAKKVADMLVVLSGLLRPVFSDWTSEWSLSEELSFSENYIRLVRLRYGNAISFTINEPPDIEGILIPRFTLQPLLENCCEYGPLPNRQLCVTIDIRVEDNVCEIDVANNGAGIPPDKLAELRQMLNACAISAEAPHRNMALVNINRRLKLMHGDASGIAIESEAQHVSVCARIYQRSGTIFADRM